MIPGITAGGGGDIPPPVAWTPANLSSPPSLWLDDTSAVTNVSGAASQWDDKSGNGYHMVQGTSGNRPSINATDAGIGGLRSLSFDGSNDFLINTSSGIRAMFQNVSSAWGFAVYKKRNAGALTSRVVTFHPDSAGNTRFTLTADHSTAGVGGTPQMQVRRLDADSTVQLTGASPRVGSYLMILGAMNFTTRAGQLYINGGLDASNATLTPAGGNTSNTAAIANGVSIGATYSATSPADVDVACVIQGVGLPSPSEIDKLFGWAAHHFGLTGLLDSGHHYKTAPPFA